jgi:opacity protein-like surface antigen
MSVSSARLSGAVLPLALACATAGAQSVTTGTETLAFDRSESWGMKYYASLSLLTSVGAPASLGKGQVLLGVEGASVPQLSDEQRRIGFDGTKLEDVNRTRVFGRLRGSVGLGAGLALDIAYVPPIELGGAKPNLFAAGLGRPFELSRVLRLGLRAHGQIGTIQADITCGADEAAAGNDPDKNPYQCVEPSKDETRQKTLGGELTLGYDSGGPVKPYVGVLVTYMDLEFQVNALYAGGTIDDHMLQTTSGTTVAATGGLTYAPSPKWRISAEAFYSWLSIARPPATSSSNEGFWNARIFASYRVH